MNANELRLGNWVEANSPMMQVKEITEHTIGLYMPGSEADPFLYDIEEIEPIKLSPEILEKCGFVKEEPEGWFILKRMPQYADFRIFMSCEGDFHFPDGEFVPDITSLHQLQNLYWCLCGEELEINM